jgi:hypothetical protein
MNKTLKLWLIIALKNAVNAIITNTALMAMLHGAFNISTRAGWWNIGKVTLSVVVSREIIVWGPVLLKWTTTNADVPAPPVGPNLLEEKK